ncbi:hypothetical protein [Nocardiopsis quinghaiensis]|uniref:hypothetical protein n=1 Tax=Nocardiopsis quinghaiensis TaxID=464995 RepID=UPI001239B007|nr:hypothetical protein [Nocardiopsis quinghaiensis]
MTDTTRGASEDGDRKVPTKAWTDPAFPPELSVAVGTDPAPLVASPLNGEPNRAGLRVLVTNVDDDKAVGAHQILVQLKVTADNSPKEDLLSESWSKRGETVTHEPGTRTPSSDDTGGYTFTYFGTDSEKPFKPGDSIALFVHDIPVSAQDGATVVAVGIQAGAKSQPVWKRVPLGKFPTGYYLRDLRADVNPVEYKEQAVLTWVAPPIDGIEYTLYANGAQVPLKQGKPQPAKTNPLTTDTTFELVPSWATDVRHRQRLLVRVLNGDISANNATVKSTFTSGTTGGKKDPGTFVLNSGSTEVFDREKHDLIYFGYSSDGATGDREDYFGEVVIPWKDLRTSGLLIGTAHLNRSSNPEARVCIWAHHEEWNGATVSAAGNNQGPTLATFTLPVLPGRPLTIGVQAWSAGYYKWWTTFRWLPFGKGGKIKGSPFTFTRKKIPEELIWRVV